MARGNCKSCGKEKEVAGSGASKDICHVCYKKHIWNPKISKCKRCSRELPMHAKALCAGCYNSVFQIEKVRSHNVRRYHNISADLYKELTRKCSLCDFNKIIELHHLDMNHENNSPENLIGLCPNHHKLIHHRDHQKEIFKLLSGLGYRSPATYDDDNKFK
jgi:hypothetical protein